jgi:hypothetical protein
MKSERRHELQTNSLSAWMYYRAPEIWNKYGNHILLGVIVLIGLIWVIRLRLEAPKKAKLDAAVNLHELQRQIQYAYLDLDAASISDIPQKLSQTLEISTDPDIQALGYVLLGDYHWLNVIVNEPDPAEQSKAMDPDFEQSLKNADKAYAAVLEQKTTQRDLIAKAHVGRAMVAEELGGAQFRNSPEAENPYWEQARKNYQAVIDDKEIPETLRANAEVRIKQLKELGNPLWVVRKKEAPTSMPALFDPTGPFDFSTTRPIMESMTRPTTLPAN